MDNDSFDDTMDFLKIMGFEDDDIDYVQYVINDDVDIVSKFIDEKNNEDVCIKTIYENLLIEAIHYNSTRVINNLLNRYSRDESGSIILTRIAIQKKNYDLMLRLLHENTQKDMSLLFCDAIDSADMRIIEYLYNEGYSHPGAILNAIDNCNIALFEYLLEKIKINDKFNPLTFDVLNFNYIKPDNNQFPYIEYCYYFRNETMIEYFIKQKYSIYNYKHWKHGICSSKTNDLIHKYSREIIGEYHDNALSKAIRENNIMQIKYLLSVGSRPNSEINKYVIENDLMEIICILSHVSRDGYQLFRIALEHGKIDIAKYYANHYFLLETHDSNIKLLDMIIQKGYLHMLKTFIAVYPNLKRYEKVLGTAIKNYQYNIFDYLVEIGVSKKYLETNYIANLCDGDQIFELWKLIKSERVNIDLHINEILNKGVTCNDLKLVNQMFDRGAKLNREDANNQIYFIKTNNNLEMLKCLIRHGLIMECNDTVLTVPCCNDNLEMIKYFVEYGVVVTKNCEAYLWAITKKFYHIADFLIDQNVDTMMNKYEAFNKAVQTKDLKCVKYVIEKTLQQYNKTMVHNIYDTNIIKVFEYGTEEIVSVLYELYKKDFDEHIIDDSKSIQLLLSALNQRNLYMIKFLHDKNKNIILNSSQKINTGLQSILKIKSFSTCPIEFGQILKYMVDNGLVLREWIIPDLLNIFCNDVKFLSDLNFDPMTLLKSFTFIAKGYGETLHLHVLNFVKLSIPFVQIIVKFLTINMYYNTKTLVMNILLNIPEIKNDPYALKVLYDWCNDSDKNKIEKVCEESLFVLSDDSFDLLEFLNACVLVNNYGLIEFYYKKCISYSYNLDTFYEKVINTVPYTESLIFTLIKKEKNDMYEILNKYLYLTTILKFPTDDALKISA